MYMCTVRTYVHSLCLTQSSQFSECCAHPIVCTVLQQVVYNVPNVQCTSQSLYTVLLQYTYLYLQCTCTYSVPVHTVYLHIQCTCTYSVPAHTVYLHIQCICTYSVPVHTVCLHIQCACTYSVRRYLYVHCSSQSTMYPICTVQLTSVYVHCSSMYTYVCTVYLICKCMVGVYVSGIGG